jgi:hypothetical protein
MEVILLSEIDVNTDQHTFFFQKEWVKSPFIIETKCRDEQETIDDTDKCA